MSVVQENDDKIYCTTIAKSISDIIRFSFDEEFRKSSFELFNVSCTKETEREIYNKLVSIIKNDNTSKKRGRKLSGIKDKETLKEGKDNLDGKDTTNQTSTTRIDSESKTFSQNISLKNWVSVSSQKYKEIIKRRKLNYFSEPQFQQTYQEYYQFSACNLSPPDFQPLSPSTSYSPCNETISSSSKCLRDSTNYCQKMFSESFSQNSLKYFRKNLKSYK